MAEPLTAPPIEVDPDELAQDSLDYLATAIDGFDPAAGTLVRFLLEATARIGGETAELASAALDDVFRYFGQLVGVEALDETQATVASTWTLTDNAGHTIAAGTLVEIQGDTESAAFAVQDDVTVDPGDTTTGAGEVILVAVQAGDAGSGLAGPADVIDAGSDFVDSIALVGITVGGRDAEEAEDFNLRLADELRLMTPTPILPAEFATLAQRRVAGVARALAIDLYDPSVHEKQQVGVIGASSGNYKLTFDGQQTATIAYNANAAAIQAALEALSNLAPGDVIVTGGPAHSSLVTIEFAGVYAARDVPQITVQNVSLGGTPALTNTTIQTHTGQEKSITVAVVDDAGADPGSLIRAEVDDLLQAMREVNFNVHVIAATYTQVDVAFTAVCLPDAVASEVEAVAEAAVTDALSPANHGRPNSGGLTELGVLWYDTPLVRYLEVAAVLDRVEGLDYVSSLTLNGGTADVALAGPAGLPTVGTVAGTVTAP
jgi:hypothetical protein